MRFYTCFLRQSLVVEERENKIGQKAKGVHNCEECGIGDWLFEKSFVELNPTIVQLSHNHKTEPNKFRVISTSRETNSSMEAEKIYVNFG